MKKCYTFITLKGLDNNYIATVPELPGVIAQAKSTEILLPRIKESITAYIKTLEKEKLASPHSLELIGVNEVEVDYE